MPAEVCAWDGKSAPRPITHQNDWLKGIKLATTQLDVQRGSASEVGRYELDIQPGTGPVVHDRGKYIVIWRKVGGQWKLYRDIFNTNMPEKK